MQIQLELLAPAKNAEIGIAAIDCGADAVYIAGPAFGARQAAGNSIEDLKQLCHYAHQFGARIFVTFNTILYDEELEEAEILLKEIASAGADAIIVQDTAVITLIEKLGGTQQLGMELHASTQCAIRTPEQAQFLERLGFSRIVLERELSLEQIKAIRNSVQCELEFFVHGALCVCYSGQCYISEYISGRSANRGACMQACRSRYDLVDQQGRILVKNKALLSLKDYELLDHLEDLAKAGACSFKIEGRLKNISYVRNVVRQYSLALDKLVAQHPNLYGRASYGQVKKGFLPDLNKTFNRGYTTLFIEGKRGKWSSMEAPKGMGEEIGQVTSIKRLGHDEMEILLHSHHAQLRLSNGDGFSFYTEKEIIGFRGDVCEGLKIRCKRIPELFVGAKIFRNMSIDFEKQLHAQPCQRTISAHITLQIDKPNMLTATAWTEDGRSADFHLHFDENATDRDRMAQLLQAQLSKKSGHYDFCLEALPHRQNLPFLGVANINAIRRHLAEQLDRIPCIQKPLWSNPLNLTTTIQENVKLTSLLPQPQISYKQNIANHLAKELMLQLGAQSVEPAFELVHRKEAELMRTKYCIRYEIGICPKYHHSKNSGPLYLVNQGRKFPLEFDCKHCEMVVKAPNESETSF